MIPGSLALMSFPGRMESVSVLVTFLMLCLNTMSKGNIEKSSLLAYSSRGQRIQHGSRLGSSRSEKLRDDFINHKYAEREA